MALRILITGGTIDCERIEEGDRYVYGETYVPGMLEQGRCGVDVRCEVVFLKRSLYATDEDRDRILQACKGCAENRIIVTHGTDSMTETARVLGREVKDKTIVLLGAMMPFNREGSDALFNLGCAVAAVQVLAAGVYVTMNGRILEWDNVRKNRERGVFEAIR